MVYRCFCFCLCVFCPAWLGIAQHLFLFWSNRVNKELGLKSFKRLATECLVKSSQLQTTLKAMHFKVLLRLQEGLLLVKRK